MSDSIADIVNGVIDDSLSDEQVIDWLQNIFDNGLDEQSTITPVSYTHLTLPTKRIV